MDGKAELLSAFEQHHDELLRFLVRRVGDPERAADVAQDVWLKIANTSVSSIENPQAYLFRLAANQVIDMARQDNRLAQRHADESLAHQLPDTLNCPERHGVARERLAALDAALATVSENARRALIMSRIEGRTFAAIAAELGVSESMVAKYIASALRVCRDHLRQLDNDAD